MITEWDRSVTTVMSREEYWGGSSRVPTHIALGAHVDPFGKAGMLYRALQAESGKEIDLIPSATLPSKARGRSGFEFAFIQRTLLVHR